MKIGRFKASRQLIFEGRQGDLGQIFQNVFPVKIEWDFNGIATYTALSEWFEDLEDGVEPVDYKFALTRNADKTLSVLVERI